MPTNVLLLIILAFFLWLLIFRRKIRFYKRSSEIRAKEQETVISFLHKIGDRITTSIDLQGSLEIITNFIVEYTHAEAGAIFLLNEEDQTLRAKVVLGLFPPLHKTTGYIFTKRKYLTERIMRDRIHIGEGIIGDVAKTGKSQLIRDAQEDPRIPEASSDFMPLESIMVSPLKIQDKVLGVLAVVNKRDGHIFSDQDMSLLESLSQQAAVTVDIVKLYEQLANQQRIEQELSLARDFQGLLLPKSCPRIKGLDIAAFSESALEVGGDYFDFIWIDEDHLGLVIGDVSGKGIPGALVMAMVRSILRAESRNNISPAAVLRVVNEYIRQDTKSNVFITMTYAIIDIPKRTVRFARAGHEPLITFFVDNPEPELYTPEGIALGLVEEDIFKVTGEKEINLATGDLIVLYTDGVVEAMNDSSEEYGQERFLDMIKKTRNGKAQEVIEAVMKDIRQFTQSIPQHDDITLIAFKVLSPSEEPLSDEKKVKSFPVHHS